MDQHSAMRHLLPHAHLGPAFGNDRFGVLAERFARGFGAPRFLIAQTVVVLSWIGWNAVSGAGFDPYPFILLNLVFSTQAAYAAPMILLAQTRQAERDRMWTEADARHREELSAITLELLAQNTALTQSVADLSRRIEAMTGEIHSRVTATQG